MSFMLSPGVNVTERDLTNIVPAVATSNGAFAGVFRWGPVMSPIQVTSENEMVQIFGSPNDYTAQSFFTAANFLSYSNNLLLVRADTTGSKNAVATQTGSVDTVTIDNGGELYLVPPIVIFSAPNIADGVQATGTANIDGGVVTSITIVEAGTGYTSVSVSITADIGDTGVDAAATATVAIGGIKINNEDVYETNYLNGQGVVGEFAAKYPGTLGNSLTVSLADAATYEAWVYKAEFDSAPEVDEVHVIVIDNDGSISGIVGGTLEKFAYLGKASDDRKSDGTNNYYKFVVNNSSKWVYWMDHPDNMNWGLTTGTAFYSLGESITRVLTGGADDFAMTTGNQMNAYELFNNAELYDISLVMAGKANAAVATYIINSIVEVRKDCVAFISPQDVSTGEVIYGTGTQLAADIVAYRDLLPSTSYAVLDSGYKYQYDRYNDQYRWVPLNGDVAGLCARTDLTNDPWWSPGGYNRGQVKNVVKLSYNPNQAARDILYKSGINPVVSFPGQGTVLFGDKTLQTKPSAFDRINVRRLFIVLEKAIATAAKFQLFEFNDEFTRAQFRSMVEPFLRDVQGRRGLYDFRVVCDETNNTGEVIDGNRFVADIYLKPARSINFIQLNFIAVRTSVSFEEVGG